VRRKKKRETREIDMEKREIEIKRVEKHETEMSGKDRKRKPQKNLGNTYLKKNILT
jgi:hypothetical protein